MKNLARYIFIFLIVIMLYLIYLVLSYKYTEYKILQYVEELSQTNIEFVSQIKNTKQILENKNTRAYKNKILKSDRSTKNKGEEVVYLIEEEIYNKYTQEPSTSSNVPIATQSLLDEESLISTMSIYQKWVYLLFNKDIR